ncbi:FAD-dependent oxidoreductase [Devosia ginsengisoli]|uniref:FAD-dependent oxidoreductase n=1 Tax=Devosia ginsengisoli TaxID=400770 RepID=UPI0026EC5DEF|nr:FAD-dependent oxidoreductase [Devosia ginsengisoli]MCR6671293.1 FAD-dependent oxidoreductase [Devosia ginsengisoli]
MRSLSLAVDVAVVGGGLAGVCAAIAAARQGTKVVLVQNRPVLGGNSSSEVRVPVAGATGLMHNRFARETGIIGELLVENQYRNKAGNVLIWDALLLEWVKRETNIRLLLNTEVHQVRSTPLNEPGTAAISELVAWTSGAETEWTISSKVYIDCTGDGFVGASAGAQFRLGREAKAETNEQWAQPAADAYSLGSTILFYTKKSDVAVPFVKPSFAIDIKAAGVPISRIDAADDSGAKYWWIEYGGMLNTIDDYDVIRDELWGIVYGIWDHIKNSGRFDADHLTLEWVGTVPGKRESRRLTGDYTITQTDVMNQRSYADTVTFGGWSVDLHDPGGAYAQGTPDRHMVSDGVFDIPYRALYSKNVANLLFAGRNISTTHAGNGATRVMATCAAMGEVVGTAGALCVANDLSPRQVGSERIDDLQQTLLRADASMIGVSNKDPGDMARHAEVSASSYLKEIALADAAPEDRRSLNTDLSILVPVHPQVDGVDLKIDVHRPTTLRAELWNTGTGRNYIPGDLIATLDIELAEGDDQWISANFDWRPNDPQNALVVLRENPDVSMHMSKDYVFGILTAEKAKDLPNKWYQKDGSNHTPPAPIQWAIRNLNRTSPVMRLRSLTEAYSPEKVANGKSRPDSGPNLWMSERSDGPEWIELRWAEPRSVGEVLVTFNDDVNERLHNLFRYETDFRVIPEIVKNYTLEVEGAQGWELIVSVDGNRQRRRRHVLETPVATTALRIVCMETNGSPYKQIVEVRVYE